MTNKRPPANPFFSIEDLASLDFDLKVKNLTSGQVLEVSLGTAAVLEMQEKGIIVELPARSCATGHTLLLHLSVIKKREQQNITEKY